MIAYLFWHWPRPSEAVGYEAALVEFQRRLLAAGVPGLRAAATYRVGGLPWLGAAAGYEDWYLLEGFADLEALNREAVGARLRAHHDRPAAAAAGGAGGLYRVVAGRPEAAAWTPDPAAGTPDLAGGTVTWLTKPASVGYPDFLASLPGAAWLAQRQLALGPAAEFATPGEVPGGLVCRREAVFAGTA